MQRGVAKGLKVPCLFMIAEVSIRCQKKPQRLVYAVYPRIPPNTPLCTTIEPMRHTQCLLSVLQGCS